MKVGDLVQVQWMGTERGEGHEPYFTGIILETYHANTEHSEAIKLVRVLHGNTMEWYPISCIKIISKNKRNN